MARIIDFPDGFTSSTEPTTGGGIASFAEQFSGDAAYESIYGSGVAGSIYFNTTLNKLRIHDGTDWRTNERALDNATTSDPTVGDDNTLGYEVLSLWLNTSSGALFRAVDVSTGAAVWTELAADAVLDSHISDTSTHGITSAIVGESETQVLTNKDIDGGTASNASRITLPKDTKANLDLLTRKEGTVWYASDEDKLYTDDGVQLNELTGGGAGGGGLDVFATQDFEDGAYTNNDSGNNATFLTAGPLDGTFALETTSPISKTQSWKYTASTASNNDWLEFEVIDLDLKQRSTDIKVRLSADMSGFSNDVTFVVYDKTNSAVLSSTLDVLTASTNRTFYEFSVFTPSNCAQISYGVHINNGATDTESFLIDDVEWSTNPFVNAEIIEEQELHFNETASGNVTVSGSNIEFNTLSQISSTGPEILTASTSSGRTRFTANRGCSLNVSISLQTSVANTSIELYKNGALYNRGVASGAGSNPGGGSYPVILSANDYIEFNYVGSAPTLESNCTFSILAQATSPHILTPVKSNMTDWVSYTPTSSGFGGIAGVDFKYRRIGDSIEIHGRFDPVAVAASEAQIGLPSGLTIDSLKVSVAKVVGHSYLSGANSAEVTVIATGGDTYLNFGRDDSGNSAVPQNGNTVANNGLSTLFFATVPIAEWSSDATFLAAVPVQKKAVVRDFKTTTTTGGNFVSGAWRTRDLNEVLGESFIVSINSNRFTLGVGKYWIDAKVPAYRVNSHAAKLVQDPGGSPIDAIMGSAGRSLDSAGPISYSFIVGEIEITTSTEFEIQHQCATTNADGFGFPSGYGTGEVYTQVEITKLR